MHRIDKLTKGLKKVTANPILILASMLLVLFGLWHYIGSSLANYFFPPTAKFAITNLIIYRANPMDFPSCEFDMIADTSPRGNLTIELREMTIFRQGITHRFPTKSETINIGPEESIFKRVSFRDEVLDNAIKLTPKASSMFIKLLYSYVQRRAHVNSCVNSFFKQRPFRVSFSLSYVPLLQSRL